MPIESNYFEESAFLHNDPDPFVSRAASRLYDHLLKNKIIPEGGFNILYFYQSVIELLLQKDKEIILAPSTEFPYPCAPINAYNVPENFDQWEGECDVSVLQDYVKIVEKDSQSSGEPFDVGYALQILSVAIDENYQLIKLENAGEDEAARIKAWLDTEEGYDEWLSAWF